MKIVLKTNNGGKKNLDKSDDKNELTKNEFKKPQNSILNLTFGLKGDNTLDNDHEIDGKHFLSRNKPENSKPTFDSLKARKFAKALDSCDKANSDIDLDPQLYLYDELVPDRNTEESAKFKYLGFVDESKNISSLDLNNDSQGRTGKSDEEPEEQVESKKESRYMSKMVTVARKRQMERDIAFEKQLLKEELKSDSNIGEVFVTGAYKKKLEERKRFEEEQKKKEEYDAVHSKNSLTKLHTYLLKTGFAKRSSTDNPNH